MRANRVVFFLLFVLVPLAVWDVEAQEYKYETGATAGLSSYLGDANKRVCLHRPGISGGGLFRYNVDFHWAVKINLLAGSVSGNTEEARNVFPMQRQTSFKRVFFEPSGQIEYNFFPFSDKFSYLDAKPYTPYVFTGVGATLATGNNLFLGVNLPIGAGFKYKLGERVNLGIEISVRKLFRDDFDVPDKRGDWNLNAPYGIKSSFLKNQDWYSLAMVFLTWDFALRHNPCCE